MITPEERAAIVETIHAWCDKSPATRSVAHVIGRPGRGYVRLSDEHVTTGKRLYQTAEWPADADAAMIAFGFECALLGLARCIAEDP